MAEALAGEAIIERFLRGDGSVERSPVALMRALLVQTWWPCRSNGGDPAIGWTLGTIFPEFDKLAQPIKRRINKTAVAVSPSRSGRRSWRPFAFGRGYAIRDALPGDTILCGRRTFDRLDEEAMIAARATRKSHLT